MRQKENVESKTKQGKAQAFSTIYNSGGWANGGDETVSGAGSTLRYTEHIRAALPIVLKGLDVKIFLDAPCGDHNWMQSINLSEIDYIGIDIVEDLIRLNSERYGAKNKNFNVSDITFDPLPRADLMLCRDLFRHIPFKDSRKVLLNFMTANIPFILATSYSLNKNVDIEGPYGSRPVDLRKAPFGLPKPLLSVPDWVDGFRKRQLCLWTRQDIACSKIVKRT